MKKLAQGGNHGLAQGRRHAARPLLLAAFALFAVGVMWTGRGAPPPRAQLACNTLPKRDPVVCTAEQNQAALDAACTTKGGDPISCTVSYTCGYYWAIDDKANIATYYMVPSTRSGPCLSNCHRPDMAQPAPDMTQAAPASDMTMTSTGGGLTLADENNRFSTYIVPSVTCTNDPSYGNVVAAPVPQSIVTALGLTASGTYTFMFYSGSFNNVLIVGPPPMGTIYYSAKRVGLDGGDERHVGYAAADADDG